MIAERYSILLVDDDETVLRGLSRVLEDPSYEIFTASNANEASSILEEQVVRVIVCDEHMPGMSGRDFLTQIAREHPGVGLIMLTGHADPSLWNKVVIDADVFRFLTKPCDATELQMAIRSFLSRTEVV